MTSASSCGLTLTGSPGRRGLGLEYAFSVIAYPRLPAPTEPRPKAVPMTLRAIKDRETPSEPRPSGSGPSQCFNLNPAVEAAADRYRPLPATACRNGGDHPTGDLQGIWNSWKANAEMAKEAVQLPDLGSMERVKRASTHLEKRLNGDLNLDSAVEAAADHFTVKMAVDPTGGKATLKARRHDG